MLQALTHAAHSSISVHLGDSYCDEQRHSQVRALIVRLSKLHMYIQQRMFQNEEQESLVVKRQQEGERAMENKKEEEKGGNTAPRIEEETEKGKEGREDTPESVREKLSELFHLLEFQWNRYHKNYADCKLELEDARKQVKSITTKCTTITSVRNADELSSLSELDFSPSAAAITIVLQLWSNLLDLVLQDLLLKESILRHWKAALAFAPSELCLPHYSSPLSFASTAAWSDAFSNADLLSLDVNRLYCRSLVSSPYVGKEIVQETLARIQGAVVKT